MANPIGNGVADDKLVYSYVPELIRFYLGEEPLLDNVRTYRMEDPADRAEAMTRLDELVVKPVDGVGGKGLVIGARPPEPSWRSCVPAWWRIHAAGSRSR